MNKNLFFVMFSMLLTTQLVIANVVYKENFPGGVYIHNGDEAYVNISDVPKSTKSRTTKLIIATIKNDTFDKWTKKEVKALTYCVSNKFYGKKNRVIDAMKVATEDWMGAGNIKFIYMPQHDGNCNASNKHVMFDVNAVKGQPYLARAFFPSYPRPYRNIMIDDSALKYDDTALEGFLRHELGHALGFRHEHISPSANGKCKEDSKFKPVTGYDRYSVMHYPQCGGKNVITNMVLTATDEQGARLVYP